MNVFLLFCVTMLCMMGLLSLVGFVVRNFFLPPVVQGVFVVPMQGDEVEHQLKTLQKMRYWSDEELCYLVLDCGLSATAKQQLLQSHFVVKTVEEFTAMMTH